MAAADHESWSCCNISTTKNLNITLCCNILCSDDFRFCNSQIYMPPTYPYQCLITSGCPCSGILPNPHIKAKVYNMYFMYILGHLSMLNTYYFSKNLEIKKYLLRVLATIWVHFSSWFMIKCRCCPPPSKRTPLQDNVINIVYCCWLYN